MVLEHKRLVTAAEFDQFVELPENDDRLFELISGEIVEVPSKAYASKFSMRVGGFFFVYLRQNDIAHLTGEQGGYRVSGERYAPDVGIVLKAKQSELAMEGYNPIPPDLAVEVDFPSTWESQRKMRQKIANYLAAGTLLWVVYPEAKEVEVYAPGQPVKVVGIDGTLDGGDVLPGFTLAVKDVFGE